MIEDANSLEQAANLLERAAERVKRGWCQGAEARDVSGKPVLPGSIHAVEWCPIGALREEWLRSMFDTVAMPLALKSLREACGFDIPVWNDQPDCNQAEVVSVIQKAATMLREGKE